MVLKPQQNVQFTIKINKIYLNSLTKLLMSFEVFFSMAIVFYIKEDLFFLQFNLYKGINQRVMNNKKNKQTKKQINKDKRQSFYRQEIVKRKPVACKHQSEFENSSLSMSQDRNDPLFHIRQTKKYKSSQWTVDQLRKIFDYYQEYGSQWAQIAKKLPNRSQNDVKNKFYGIIKNVLRGIFKVFKNVPGSYLKAITSRKICLIYQGRGQYTEFKGFIRKALQFMQFTICKEKFKQFVESQKSTIQKLNQILFRKKIDGVQKMAQQQAIIPCPRLISTQLQQFTHGINQIDQRLNRSFQQPNCHRQQILFPMQSYWIPSFCYSYQTQFPYSFHPMPLFNPNNNNQNEN